MILTTALEIVKFADKNGWVLIAKRDDSDKILGVDYISYLTPHGTIVSVEFYPDGNISRIISR